MFITHLQHWVKEVEIRVLKKYSRHVRFSILPCYYAGP